MCPRQQIRGSASSGDCEFFLTFFGLGLAKFFTSGFTGFGDEVVAGFAAEEREGVFGGIGGDDALVS